MKVHWIGLMGLVVLVSACSKDSATAKGGASDGTVSQLSAATLGGSSNDNINGGHSGYAELLPVHKPTWKERFQNAFDLVPSAFAFSVSCTGGTLTPSTYAAGTTFQWAPISCTFTYLGGEVSSVAWTGDFNFTYSSAVHGNELSARHPAGWLCGNAYDGGRSRDANTEAVDGPDAVGNDRFVRGSRRGNHRAGGEFRRA